MDPADDVKAPSLTTKAAKGIVWFASGNMIRTILQLLPVAVLARLLSPEEFGVMTGALVLIALSEQIAYSGVGPTIVQIDNLRKDHIGTAYWMALGTSLVVALLLIVFAGQIEAAMGVSGLALIVPIVAATIPINSLGVVSARLMQRDLQFGYQITVDTVGYIFGYYTFGIVLAYLGYGVNALVMAFVGHTVFRSVALFVKNLPRFTLATSRQAARELYGSSLAVVFGGILNELGNNADRLGIGNVLGPAALGLYGRASELTQRGGRVFEQVVVRAVFPAFARKQAEPEKLLQGLLHTNTLSFLAIGSVVAVMLAFAEQIIQVMYGPGWGETITPFMLLSLSLIFAAPFRLSLTASHSLGLFWSATFVQLLFAISTMVSAFYLARLGISAVATGILVLSLAKVCLMNAILSRKLGITFKNSAHSVLVTVPLLALCVTASLFSEQAASFLTDNPLLQLLVGVPAVGLICAGSVLLYPRLFLGPALDWLSNRIDSKFLKWLNSR